MRIGPLLIALLVALGALVVASLLALAHVEDRAEQQAAVTLLERLERAQAELDRTSPEYLDNRWGSVLAEKVGVAVVVVSPVADMAVMSARHAAPSGAAGAEIDLPSVTSTESWRRLLANADAVGAGSAVVASSRGDLALAAVTRPLDRQLPGQRRAMVVAIAAEPLGAIVTAAEHGRNLIGAAFIATLLGLALAFIRPLRRAATSIRDLRSVATQMLEDLSIRARRRGKDEIAKLGDALDLLADQLSGSLQRLARERDRLGGILETMAEGVLLTDASGNVVLANASLRTMVGSGVGLGKQPIEVVRNDQLADIIEQATRLQRTVSGEIDWLGPVVERVRVRAAPIAGGDNPGIVVVLSDVTDLRRLEAVRRDFVANVSHELRTPVAAIRAAIETLDSGASADPARAKEFLEMIGRHSARLHQLVEDLLDLSRIEAHRLKLSIEAIQIAPFFDSLIALYALSAKRRGLSLEATLPLPGQTLVARADRRALEQILSNLIDNAIKYSTHGATIDISARAADREIAISVVDTGPGIPAHHLPRIFERFYRVDRGRSRDVGGTGLGLAIVKHLAEAQLGRVDVESTPGRGSTFTVYVPAAGA